MNKFKKKRTLALLFIVLGILLTRGVANAASLSNHVQYGDHYVDRISEASGTIVYGSLSDDMDPFLCPNQRVWYDQDSKVVALGKEIAAESTDANDYIQKVYSYITNNFSYDEEKAESVKKICRRWQSISS